MSVYCGKYVGAGTLSSIMLESEGLRRECLCCQGKSC